MRRPDQMRQSLDLWRKVRGTCGPTCPYSGRDCAKSLRSSYTGLYPQRTWETLGGGAAQEMRSAESMSPEMIKPRLESKTEEEFRTWNTLGGGGAKVMRSADSMSPEMRRACAILDVSCSARNTLGALQRWGGVDHQHPRHANTSGEGAINTLRPSLRTSLPGHARHSASCQHFWSLKTLVARLSRLGERQSTHSHHTLTSASDQRGNSSKRFYDFHLKAKARIWP